MAARNISITPELLAHAQARVDSGKFETVSEYIRSLVRADLEREEAVDWLIRETRKSLESGIEEVTVEDLGIIIQNAFDEVDREAAATRAAG